MELQENDVLHQPINFASQSARLGRSRSLSVRFNLGGLRGKPFASLAND